MDGSGGSLLPDIARIEQEKLSRIESVTEDCRERIADCRLACQEQLAAVPGMLQEERRDLIKCIREEAEANVTEEHRIAEEKAGRVDTVVAELSSELRHLVLCQILPQIEKGES